jgi:serpin B
MTRLGARGETAQEMSAVLGIPADDSAYHAALGALLADLGGPHRGRGYQLYLANRLFGQQGSPFAADFLDAASTWYGAPLETVDYQVDAESARQHVNGWVSDNTQGEIEQLVPPGVFDENTRLTLVNAIYFKAGWASAFDPSKTREAPFLLDDGSEKSIPLMTAKGNFLVAEDDLFSLLSLDYSDGELAMLIVLPLERGGLARAEPELNAARLRALVSSLGEKKVVVSLPRFAVSSEISLVPALRELGMQAAFDPVAADFSGMLEPGAGEPLYVKDVLHQGYVRVDEAGTTAAASTAVVVTARSIVPEFRADHPFVFAIRDKLTGALLFLGKLADPR